MAIFPGAISSFAGFVASHTLATDNHASQHNSEQAEIVAVQTKVGTGSSTPTTGTVLTGTGAGTSSWSQVNLTTMVTGILPQANGGTGTTSATGTGSNVYQTSPTINSPTITSPTITNATISADTITGYSSSLISTIAGLQISNGVLNTSNSTPSSSLQGGSVTPPKLDLSSIGIISSNSNSANILAAADVDTLVLTIPSGCTMVYIIGTVRIAAQDATLKDMFVWIDYNAGTQSKLASFTSNATFMGASVSLVDTMAVTSGSKTFKLRASASAGATGMQVSTRTVLIIPAYA